MLAPVFEMTRSACTVTWLRKDGVRLTNPTRASSTANLD